MVRLATIMLVLSCLSLSKVAVTESLAAESPPNVNIASEISAAEGPVDGPAILEMEGLVKSERYARSGVELYERHQEIPGITDMMPELGGLAGGGGATGIIQYFEVVHMDIDGRRHRFVSPVPPEEMERRRLAAGDIGPQELARGLEEYTAGLLAVGAIISEEMPMLGMLGGALAPPALSREAVGMTMSACGALARGEETFGDEYGSPLSTSEYLAGGAEGSWTSPDPLTFLTGPACFTMFTAQVLRATDLTEEQKKEVIVKAREDAASRIELAGRETVDGRPTYHLEMTDLDLSQTAEDGTRYDFERASVWIDEEYFVRRKVRFEGEMHAEGESRDFFMESIDSDYRNVPDSHLYEPYRTVLRVGGVTTPEQEREMQTALAQLEDYEQQLASMPASQRAMVERMMGDKIDQARSLAEGGAVEFEMITTSIVINPDFGAGPSLLDDGPELVRTIQQGLTTLGYDPGPVTGEMNPQTAVAIVRFESERGMEVTGEATPALAAAIRAANR